VPTESPPNVIADVILDPYRDAKPFVIQPVAGAEKVQVICIITDLLTEPGKLGNPVEGERDSGLKLNAIPL
jgi:hypothetical protein